MDFYQGSTPLIEFSFEIDPAVLRRGFVTFSQGYSEQDTSIVFEIPLSSMTVDQSHRKISCRPTQTQTLELNLEKKLYIQGAFADASGNITRSAVGEFRVRPSLHGAVIG